MFELIINVQYSLYTESIMVTEKVAVQQADIMFYIQ